ncbi:chromate resistance protein ChrB domain-containing protein [Sphingomonas adhaesiva]|uniref:Sulfurtransferase n=1 Tax=Sphingomonas adhaesiva TaxID=28212 RepID=A0A2A4I2U5_9SPHN|nr:sulfurtransferase/chromate resistance protein [Sphingomonas adhaesiva]PCG13297.1 sulfurtransferase [Sphingomonas adhaesiva]
MPSTNAITADKLARLVATPRGPAIIDIRAPADFDALPKLIPGAVRRGIAELEHWPGSPVLLVCGDGRAASQGAAAWLRQAGTPAEVLEGGMSAWIAAGQPTIDTAALPPRDAAGRTLWVTRARPKVDRIACPWLIRRFVDPQAQFLFVPAPDVLGVAERMAATPFDIQAGGLQWTHYGERCTFDAMVEGFGLTGFAPLERLATIVRGADTGCPDLAPEAPGLLAISLGLSRAYADDLEHLEAGLLVYDALYRWCRDATGETHDWASHTPATKRVPA